MKKQHLGVGGLSPGVQGFSSLRFGEYRLKAWRLRVSYSSWRVGGLSKKVVSRLILIGTLRGILIGVLTVAILKSPLNTTY